MQIMIVSDSHAMDEKTLLSIFTKHDVQAYFHCGDIFMTYETLAIPNFYIVKGNNDFGEIPKELSITLDNVRFFITHGHRYDVNYDIDVLLPRAKERQADVVCFGHTHRPVLEYRDSILFINPGSLLFPRGRYRNPTYCIFDTITKKTVFYDVQTNLPCDPFETTKKKSFLHTLFKKRNG